VVKETDMTTQSTQSRSFTQSFDSRLLGWGAVGIVALIVAAFISLATPQFTANAAPATDVSRGTLTGSHTPRDGATAAKPPAPRRGYDGAGSSLWPMS
jgi:hypothetical protein